MGWGADEELLLISGLILNGVGNWAEVAGHIGTRSKEECEQHYIEVYLGQTQEDEGVQKEFMPVCHPGENQCDLHQPMERVYLIEPDEFQAHKKARIENMRKVHGERFGRLHMLTRSTSARDCPYGLCADQSRSGRLHAGPS